MKSIQFLLETICSKIFRCNYLTKKKIFPLFFLHFRNLDSIVNIFKKKMTLIPDIFFNLGTPRKVGR